jgi:hypothetical protein
VCVLILSFFLTLKFILHRKKIPLPKDKHDEFYRIGREYNRQMFIRHNTETKDLTTKSYMKTEALNALPPKAKEAALKSPMRPPAPGWRPYPIFDTPPIPDFDHTKYLHGGSDEFLNEEEEKLAQLKKNAKSKKTGTPAASTTEKKKE